VKINQDEKIHEVTKVQKEVVPFLGTIKKKSCSYKNEELDCEEERHPNWKSTEDEGC
jgi:hypothetical protein